jgi:hypothetical protein
MKKLLLIALAPFAIVSCNNDDDNDENVSLYGTWKLTSATLPVGVDFNNDGTASTDFMAETGCFNNSTIIFTDDVASAIVDMQSVDILQQNNGSYSVTCTAAETTYAPFTESGSIVTLTSDDFSAPFSRVGNRLTSSYNGTTVVFTKQ